MDNDEMKDMLKKLFIKKAMEEHPAEVSAKMEKDNIRTRIIGRGIDVLTLALNIAEKSCKETGTSCEDFCKLLKKGWSEEVNYEEKFNEIFGDLFEDSD